MGGQEQFHSAARVQKELPRTHGVLLVYDITSETSIQELQNYTSSHAWSNFQGVKFLVGTKCDLKPERQVSAEAGIKLAGEHGCKFFEVSAKTGWGVPAMLHKLES
jgi:GTPase SAR1 family protein